MKILTREILEQMKTEAGGFTSATVEALGLKWKELKKGWTFKIIGNEYAEEAIDAAIAGRHKGKKFKTRKDTAAYVIGNSQPLTNLTDKQVNFAIRYCGLREAEINATPPVVIKRLIQTTIALWDERKKHNYS